MTSCMAELQELKKESNLVHPQLCLEKGNLHIPAPTTLSHVGLGLILLHVGQEAF